MVGSSQIHDTLLNIELLVWTYQRGFIWNLKFLGFRLEQLAGSGAIFWEGRKGFEKKIMNSVLDKFQIRYTSIGATTNSSKHDVSIPLRRCSRQGFKHFYI